MEEKLNLFQKLAKIRQIADVAKRDKKGYNYTYADITGILANVTAGMKKYGVSLVPSIVPGTSVVKQNVVVNSKIDKTGKPYDQTVTEMLYEGQLNFQWIDDEDPNTTFTVPWFATGAQTDPSQAFGSAMTYCTRYFLTNYFQIAQTDTDVDAYRSKQKEAEASEEKAIAKEIIAQFDSALKTYLSDCDDAGKAKVKAFISKYVKNAEYNKITDPKLAAKLLEDFGTTFHSDKQKT